MTIAPSAIAAATPAPTQVSLRSLRQNGQQDGQPTSGSFRRQLNSLSDGEATAGPHIPSKDPAPQGRRNTDEKSKKNDSATVVSLPIQVSLPAPPPLALMVNLSADGQADTTVPPAAVGSQPSPDSAPAQNLAAFAVEALPIPAAVPASPDPAPKNQTSANSSRNQPAGKTSDAPAQAAAPEMAFAARVRPAQAPNRSEQNAQNAPRPTADQFAPVRKPETEDNAAAKDLVHADVTQSVHNSAAAFDQPPAPPPSASATPAHDSVSQVQHTEATAPRADAAPKAVQPLRELSMQVAESHQQKVEVHLVDQSGELRLSVRSGDSDLVHGLRQNLPELVNKLEDTGFRAETWRPADSAAPAAAAADTKNASNHSRQGDAQSQSGWSQQPGDQRNRNQSNRPRWVEEMESSLGGDANQ